MRDLQGFHILRAAIALSLSLTLINCTRSVDSKSKLTVALPSSAQSAQSTELLARAIINIRKNGALVEKFTWVHPCADDTTAALCAGNSIYSIEPPVFEFEANLGDVYLVQVLGVYLADPVNGDTMIFKYDEAEAEAQEATVVDLSLENVSITDKEVRLIGRYLGSSGQGPTGTVEVSFQPPSGTFPMELFDDVMIGGWMNLFAIDAAKFTYTLKETGEVLFESLDPTPGAQPDVTSETQYRKRFFVANSFREDTQGGVTIFEAQEGGEVIVGFFGDYPASNPSDFALCYDSVNEVTISGMYADPTGSTPFTFDTISPYSNNSIYPTGAGGDPGCVSGASNTIPIKYDSFDGWLGGLGGFLSAYVNKSSSGGQTYLDSGSPTAITGGQQYSATWDYLDGVYASAIAGSDVFVADTNLENELRETEYWNCAELDARAVDYVSDLSVYDNQVVRITPSSEDTTGGSATIDIRQDWVDNSLAEGILCPYVLNTAGVKEYIPAGVGNHGFYGGSVSSSDFWSSGRDGSITISAGGATFTDTTQISAAPNADWTQQPGGNAADKYLGFQDKIVGIDDSDGLSFVTTNAPAVQELDAGDTIVWHVSSAWSASLPDINACGGGLERGSWGIAKVTAVAGATVSIDTPIPPGSPGTLVNANIGAGSTADGTDHCNIHYTRMAEFEEVTIMGTHALSFNFPGYSTVTNERGLAAISIKSLYMSSGSSLNMSMLGSGHASFSAGSMGIVGSGSGGSSENRPAIDTGLYNQGGGGANAGDGGAGLDAIAGGSALLLCSAALCSPFDHSKMFYGAGGAGDGSSTGGNGGGIVLLFIESISGTGDIYIGADGANTPPVTDSGGGAAGTVVLVNKNAPASINVNYSAQGGSAAGNGGGGSGGLVQHAYCPSTANSTPAVFLNGGPSTSGTGGQAGTSIDFNLNLLGDASICAP